MTHSECTEPSILRCKMTDREMLEFGRASAYMVSPQASYGPTRPTFIIQCGDARGVETAAARDITKPASVKNVSR